MFHAEYSSGQPLCILVDLRTAVESALAHRARLNGGNMKMQSAAAGASSGGEFEISEPEPWSGETGG
jgi:hypothetical protein